MRYLFLLIALTFGCSAGANDAVANDWMFRPSYYSHVPAADAHAAPDQMTAQFDPLFPQPVPRSAYRPAHAQLGPGFAVRGAYRYNVYRLWSGRSYDTTIFRHFSFEGTAAR